MKYHYLRLFLLPQAQLPLFEESNALPANTTRPEYLSYIFRQRIDFIHRKKQFVYVPIGEEERDTGPVLLGRVGRLVYTTVNAPPEADFEEIDLDSWRAANLLIDTSDQPDGQKVAFQHHAHVGKPLPIAESLVMHINRINPISGWLMEINPITEKQSFWDAVSQHGSEITRAEFTFVTPNIFGFHTTLNDDLRRMREQHNASSVTEVLQNPKGNLDLKGENIEGAVEYITEGGGQSKLKAGSDTVYDSTHEGKVMEVDEDEPLAKEKHSTWKRITSKLFK